MIAYKIKFQYSHFIVSVIAIGIILIFIKLLLMISLQIFSLNLTVNQIQIWLSGDTFFAQLMSLNCNLKVVVFIE